MKTVMLLDDPGMSRRRLLNFTLLAAAGQSLLPSLSFASVVPLWPNQNRLHRGGPPGHIADEEFYRVSPLT